MALSDADVQKQVSKDQNRENIEKIATKIVRCRNERGHKIPFFIQLLLMTIIQIDTMCECDIYCMRVICHVNAMKAKT